MVTARKTGDKHLLRGIELSDVSVSRPADTAGTSRTAAHTHAQQDRQEAPYITLQSKMTRKQLLGLGTIGLLGMGAIAGGFAWAGVENKQLGKLRGTNKMLNNQLAQQSATNQRLQTQMAALAAAPVASATSVTRAAPPPPVPVSFDTIREALGEQEVTFPQAYLEKVAHDWSTTNPGNGATFVEETLHGNVTYQDSGLTLFGSSNAAEYQDIQANLGIPAFAALSEDAYPLAGRNLAAAAGAIVAANPEFITSLFQQTREFGPVEIPLNFQSRTNPFGFDQLVLPVTTDVLTDGNLYVRGTNPLREVDDPIAIAEGGSGESGVLPNAHTWFPLLQKQADKIEDLSLTEGSYMTLSDVGDAMTTLTGNQAESRGLTRLDDVDGLAEASTSGFDSSDAAGVLSTLPSKTFDANIANLVENMGSRAATFRMRDASSLVYMPNGTEASAYSDGVFIEPAMGGAGVHVKTDDNKVNEVFFSSTNYVFLDGTRNATTGDLASVLLTDLTGATIDCNDYESWMNISADATVNWGVYGNNATLLSGMDQEFGIPSIWQSLPLKSATIELPYNVFKKLAVWTDQVAVPTVGNALQSPVDAPSAAPFFG